MIKIGIYCNFTKPIDFAKVDEGNPGIGGTQYCFALLMKSLFKYFCRQVQLTYYMKELNSTSELFDCKQVQNWDQLFRYVESDKIDFLIIRTELAHTFYEKLAVVKPCIKVVLWSHNYFNASIASLIAKSSHIVANVFVSKQMYDFYYDHDVILKSTYIFNPVVDNQNLDERNYQPHSAVYMGSIIEEKGIIQLLKIWDKVLKVYPDAVLKIIGNGNIYFGGKAKLGSLGIASLALENKIKPFLCNKNGGKDNYQLLGTLGKEKYHVFKQCAVGIVNPSAKTETFGLGIIEMATVGLPVVTKCWNGHLDTVVNGETGLMSFTIAGMANCIIRLFDDRDLNLHLGRNAKERTAMFAPEEISRKWYELFVRLKNNQGIERLPISKPLWNNYKFLRYINSFLKYRCHLSFLPAIESVN